MLVKRTAKSQITLPRNRADEVRARLAQLAIEDKDVQAAVIWAREVE
jgi:hypothetical protein